MELASGQLDVERYPAKWSEFVGQEDAKEVLLVAASSSAKRGVPMGHTLISSPVAGIGKTSLALLTAYELGVDIHVHAGPIKEAQLPFVFMDMKDRDVLFLDEAHRLVQGGKHNGEWLLHLLQDGTYPTPLGMEPAPKITVIAATTDAGRLPVPILERFEIQPQLRPYDDDDGTRIVLVMSAKILEKDALCAPTMTVAEAIARAANNSPRMIRRILCAVRDLVWAEKIPENGGNYDLTRALKFVGVTEDGLTEQARNYLKILVTDFHGNPAGERVMAKRLGEVGNGVGELERLLLDKGLIALTGRGRTLTVPGVRRARQLLAEEAA